MAMTEKSCPPPISFIHWLSDRNQHRAFTGTRPLIATEPTAVGKVTLVQPNLLRCNRMSAPN
jgi:hypothetical protein